MEYREWEETIPPDMRGDPLWRMHIYRTALYAAELARDDGELLATRSLTSPVAAQLMRAVGSIGVNIAEGYSRFSKRDRTRFYEYALGSAREARSWYYQVRRDLGEDTTSSRISTLSSIARVLTVLISQTRSSYTPQKPEPQK